MQLATRAAAGHRTAEEFRETLDSLDDAGWHRLDSIAAAVAATARVEADDLLHDAILSVVEEARPWPQEVNFFWFMRGVMRSLASGEARHRAKSPIRSPQSLFGEDGDLLQDAEDDQPDPERVAIASEEWKQVRKDLDAMFEGDDDASLILMGLADGNEGEELRAETGLDPTPFATKRKQVRRKLNAYWVRRGRK